MEHKKDDDKEITLTIPDLKKLASDEEKIYREGSKEIAERINKQSKGN